MLVPKSEPMEESSEETKKKPQIRVSNFATQPPNLVTVINQLQQKQKDTSSSEPEKSENVSLWIKQDNGTTSKTTSIFIASPRSSETLKNDSSSAQSTPTSGTQKSIRRRVRRKHNSPDEQAEALTEMSVRGLNLFRYASIQDGVYKCTECAKENVQKTFKNKYSFQRHAFLYHEGTQRKVFPCPVCRKEFSRPDKMKNHMKMTHESYINAKDNCNFPLPLMIAGSSTAPIAQSINNNIVNMATSQ